MRLKYQLRGLGLGIILTGLLMGISSDSIAKPLTDEQIKARAKELGMVENAVLTELETKTQETESSEPVSSEAEITEEPSNSEAESTEEPTSIEEESTVPESIQPISAEPERLEQMSSEIVSEVTKESTEETQKAAVIVIQRGDGSDTVSRKLEKAGLITNAAQYDRYLCQNGFDKRLRTGTYEIPFGATEEEIAKKISQ